MDLLVVDFQIGALHQKFLFFRGFDDVHDMAKGARNDALEFVAVGYTHHRECLPATSLTVRKYGSVVSLDHGFDQVEGSLLVDGHLCRIQTEDAIVCKVFIVVGLVRFTKDDLVCSLVGGNHHLAF